jgi:hypothetical protein
MNNGEKLVFLLKELKLAAKEKNCWDNNGANGVYYEHPEDSQEAFDNGQEYGYTSFARGLLAAIGETYD